MLDQLPAVVTLLTVLLLFATMITVGRARMRYGIKAPATTGDPAFERAFRVQMNTLEASVLFLPTLWLAAHFGLGAWAGLAGIVWIIGRAWYAASYLRDPAKREGGFVLGMAAWAAVLLLAIYGTGRALFA